MRTAADSYRRSSTPTDEKRKNNPVTLASLGWDKWRELTARTYAGIRDERAPRGYMPQMETLVRFGFREKSTGKPTFGYPLNAEHVKYSRVNPRHWYTTTGCPQDTLVGWENLVSDFVWIGADKPDLFIVEGQWDSMALTELNYPAVALLNNSQRRVSDAICKELRRAGHIFLLPDNDGLAESRAAVESVKAQLDKEGLPVSILEFPGDIKDVCQFWKRFGSDALREYLIWQTDALKGGCVITLRTRDAAPASPAVLMSPYVGNAEYMIQRMSDVEPKRLEWFWKNRIPKGKLTLFAGSTEVGKSLITCSLTAIATKGLEFPDGDRLEAPIDVLMFFCEDDAADTVRPRLDAAGAEVGRVITIKKPIAKDAVTKERKLEFDKDRAILEKALKENPEIKLVFVDPISSFLGDVPMWKEQMIRSVLVPLADMAAQLDVTFVLIAHFNKRSDVKAALDKVMGAVALQGVCRAAWLFAPEETEDEEGGEDVEGISIEKRIEEQEPRYLMVRGKMNLGRKTDGLTYTIAEKDLPTGATPYVQWGEPTSVSAEAALSLSDAPLGGKKIDAAVQFVKDALKDGARRLVASLYDEAKATGHAEKTTKRAMSKLSQAGWLKLDRPGGKGRWYIQKV